MKSFFALIAILSTLLTFGCTSVVTSETPIKLSKLDDNFVLDGLPYFLPKSKVHIDIAWNKDENNWNLDIKPVILPDYDSPQFLLKRNSNALFDDDTTFTVDQNGLLNTIKVSTTDKTISSIGELVTAAGNAFAFGAGLSPGVTRAKKAKSAEGEEVERPSAPPAPKPSAFHGDFDPDKEGTIPIAQLETPTIKVLVDKWKGQKPGEITSENGFILKTEMPITYLANFKIKCKRLVTPPTTRTDILPEAYPLRGMVETNIDEASAKKNVAVHGIVVRVAVPYEITITTDDDKGQTAIMMLPDKQNYIFPLSRRYLVQDKTDVALKDGMIQTIQQVRPSMVAGIVGIPKTILSALVPIPIQIRQSQVNNLQAIETSIKLKKEIKDLQSK